MTKYKSIAITCQAKDLLDELAKLNPGLKKHIFVSELIEQEYKRIKEAK
jgi:hypothetical protein